MTTSQAHETFQRIAAKMAKGLITFSEEVEFKFAEWVMQGYSREFVDSNLRTAYRITKKEFAPCGISNDEHYARGEAMNTLGLSDAGWMIEKSFKIAYAALKKF